MRSILNLAARNKSLLFFLLKSCAMVLAWFILYEGYIKKSGNLDYNLTKITAQSTILFLKPFYELNSHFKEGSQLISMQEISVLRIAHNCNGLGIFALFTGFIIAFPGPLSNKLWFIPLGLIALFLLNILRTISLTVIQINAPQYLDFNHKYTFIVVVYGALFYLWHIWVSRLSKEQ